MLKLAFIFLKIGFLSFGGGWAIVGILKNELVTGGFLSPEEFSQAVSIAQMTPGPVAINLATYTGYKFFGLIGAVLNTLAFLGAPILVITTAIFLRKYVKLQRVRLMKALEGATTTLLIVTLLSLLSSVQNPVLILLSAAAFVCSFFKVHPLFIIFGCGVIGAILGF
ncbi:MULTISPECIES: chromate transporter [Thermotoga]|uniref:Chromate transport protein, putative n=1 Tax=Thermotoga maritima (strain ATCC 43589 / DSM 3109 / JCM 10099 / NBRC 100826 / MSB8) TaxID=243274 RepID=Q9X2D8_THEMA|nr:MULTISPECIES: chromate transporter [Thermotoga]AAD36881.1 chromate transport protein, putative [Thermotoga maritima MSB8]AGL50752.1 chromate transport protein, putative [Thermotoga maritima MSB8]AHD18289.1 chromate transporter [Thermotoga maritima MSB8]AIY88322.1 chromate transport protein [Thermotoga sp. Cell2]AJG40846.1 chromate transporter [Thermotoga sp. RQ7]